MPSGVCANWCVTKTSVLDQEATAEEWERARQRSNTTQEIRTAEAEKKQQEQVAAIRRRAVHALSAIFTVITCHAFTCHVSNSTFPSARRGITAEQIGAVVLQNPITMLNTAKHAEREITLRFAPHCRLAKQTPGRHGSTCADWLGSLGSTNAQLPANEEICGRTEKRANNNFRNNST